MFFSSSGAGEQANKYDLLMDTASFADRNGFPSIWTPEGHFHEFGGLYPNPSVPSAALAMISRNVQIRAGSLISPLHDPVRIAEEWVVVDKAELRASLSESAATAITAQMLRHFTEDLF